MLFPSVVFCIFIYVFMFMPFLGIIRGILVPLIACSVIPEIFYLSREGAKGRGFFKEKHFEEKTPSP